MPGKATKTTELRVSTKNAVGALAKCTTPLKADNINVDCFCAYEQDNDAIFCLVTNNNPKAKTTLTSAGWTVTENPVVLWAVDNTPGELSRATTALAEARVNINYCYSSSVPGGRTQCVVFVTNDNNKTLDTLNRL